MANRIIQEMKNFSVGPDAPADPNDVSVPNQVKPKGRIAQEMPAPKGRIATEMADEEGLKPAGLGGGGRFRGAGYTGEIPKPPRTLPENIRDMTILDVLAHLPFSPLHDYERKGAEAAKKKLRTGSYSPSGTYGMTPMGGYMMTSPPQTGSTLQRIVKEDRQERERGQTMAADIASGIADLPAFMGEFAMLGGPGKSAGSALLKNVRPGPLKAVAGAAVRAGTMTAFQQHRIESSLIDQIESGQSGATALAKAWGDVYIENITEMAGEGFPAAIKRMPFGGRLLEGMRKFAKSTGMSDSQFWTKVSTRAGYNGMLGEWGEERMGTWLRGLTGVNDFGAGKDATPDQRIAAGFAQDFKAGNMLREGAVLLAPGAAKFTGKSIFGRKETPDTSAQSEQQIIDRYSVMLDQIKEEGGPQALQKYKDTIAQAQAELANEQDILPDAKPDELGPVEAPPVDAAPAKQPWEMTDKEFMEGGWGQFPGGENQKILLPSEYQMIAKNEGEQARNLVYELNCAEVETLDTHKTDTGFVIHIPLKQLDRAQGFIDAHSASVRTENIGHYIEVPTTPAAEGGKIIVPEQIQSEKRVPQSKKGPGLTAEESKIVPSNVADEMRFAQNEGDKVGYKQGLKQAKEKINQIRKDFRQKNIDRNATVQQLKDYAKENLPLSVRGKMVSLIASVKTEKQLQNSIELVDRYADMYRRKALRTTIITRLGKTKPKKADGILKGKYTADVQKHLDYIRSQVKADRNEVINQMRANVEAYENGNMPYDELVTLNDRLNMAGLKGMSADELQNVLGNVDSLIATGKTLRQVQREADYMRRQAVRTDAIDIVTGGKGLKAGSQSMSREQSAAKKWILDKLTNWQYAWDNLLDKISKHDKSMPYHSKLSQFGSEVHRAEGVEARGKKTQFDKGANAAKQIFNVETDAELNDVLNSLNQKVKLGTFKNADGVEINIEATRDAFIKKYMEMQDPSLDLTFRGYITDKGEIKGMRWTDEIMQAVNNSLTPSEKAWGDWQIQFYNEYYDGINEVYRNAYGVDLPRNPNYSPIRRDVDIDIPENILLAREASHYASTRNPSLKTRQANVRPLKFNGATSTLANHVTRMEHFKAWTGTMADMRSVFGDPDVRKAIDQYHGQGILKEIDIALQDMARGGVDKAKVNRTADLLRRNFTRAQLGLKPAIAIKQTPSLLAYLSEMPVGDFFRGVVDFWGHPIRNYRTLIKESPNLAARWGQGYERDIRYAMQKDPIKMLSKGKNVSQYLFALIRSMDQFATMQGAWAKRYSELKIHGNKAKAIAEAEDLTGRTQPTSRLSTLSSIQRGGSFAKLLTMFQNQPNKYFRMIADNARNAQYGRQSVGKSAANIALGWAFLPMVFQFISDGLRFDKERQLRAVALGPLNKYLIIGQAAESMVGWAMGEMYEYQGSPVVSTAKHTQRAVGKTRKVIKDAADPLEDFDWEDVVSAIEYWSLVAGQLTGVPTPYGVQVEKAIRSGQPENLVFSEYALGRGKKPNKTNELAAILKIQQDAAARKVSKKEKATWDTLGPRDQARLKVQNPEWKEMQREISYERLKETSKLEKSFAPVIQKEMQSLKIHYPLISRTVKGIPSEIAKAGGIDNNWRLDDKKYGEYKKHIITFVNTKLSEINDPEYKQMPDEGKREMWNKWFKAAREIATAKVGGADIMSLIGAP